MFDDDGSSSDTNGDAGAAPDGGKPDVTVLFPSADDQTVDGTEPIDLMDALDFERVTLLGEKGMTRLQAKLSPIAPIFKVARGMTALRPGHPTLRCVVARVTTL